MQPWIAIIMLIKLYEPSLQKQWDELVIKSRNGTFLLFRDYMDYHHHRFQDYSLVVYDDDDRLIALFPANRIENTIISHQGLTYGGFIYDHSMTQPRMLKVFQSLITFVLANNIHQLIYKSIPHIYHRSPANEDLYALFLMNAILHRRDCLNVIDRANPLPFQERRRRAVKKAQKLNFNVKQTEDFHMFWEVLTDNLSKAHKVLPVHTIDEITLLAHRFPQNIKLFACYEQTELLAGVVIYETDFVAHFQYIGATEKGKTRCALDFLFATLIQNIYTTKRYIDFGISNECEGRQLNEGLIDFKEGFGGRCIVHDHYSIAVSPSLIDNIDRALI